MIVDKIESYLRGEYTPTPEQFALADAMSKERGARELAMFNGFFSGGYDHSKDDDRPTISGSSPFWCVKRLQYGVLRAEKLPVAPRTLWAWYIGRCVESMVQRLVVLTYEDVRWPRLIDGELVEKECTLDTPAGPIKGHVDLVVGVNDKEIPVEVKSSATYGWNKTKREKVVDDMFGHRTQCQFYANAMEAPGAIYISVKKETGHYLELHLDTDPRFAEGIRKVVDEVTTATDMGVTLDRPTWANEMKSPSEFPGMEQVGSVRCSYCSWVNRCHAGVERRTNKRGTPVWLRPKE